MKIILKINITLRATLIALTEMETVSVKKRKLTFEKSPLLHIYLPKA